LLRAFNVKEDDFKLISCWNCAVWICQNKRCQNKFACEFTIGSGKRVKMEGAKSGGLGEISPPAGSKGREPVGLWGQSPQRLKKYN